jgi:hypothetical protein
MPVTLLTLVILGPAAVVVVALFLVLWRTPPVGINLIVVLSVLLVHFPLALVPTFLVPLAFTLHVISLWQLLGDPWVTRPAAASAVSR